MGVARGGKEGSRKANPDRDWGYKEEGDHVGDKGCDSEEVDEEMQEPR